MNKNFMYYYLLLYKVLQILIFNKIKKPKNDLNYSK